MLQVADQLPQFLIADGLFREPRHLALGPATQALRVADVAGEEVAGEVFGGVVGDVQVRPELGVACAIESVAGQAVLQLLGG